jgi:ATP-binding cassette subfamily B protein RaxB
MINPHLQQLSFWRARTLPVLLQAEAAECGLASLSMVASYWGNHTDIAGMRRRFSVSLKGVTLKGLIAMADGMGLQTRPLKLDIDDLPNLKLPCILHWNLNHFVVLKSISRQHFTIHDPAVGQRRLALADFSKSFTGVALELSPTSAFKKEKETPKFSLLSLMGNIFGLKRGLLQLLLLGLALQVCALAAPFYMQWLVDEALLTGDHDLITILGSGFLLLVVIQTTIGAVRSWMATVLATNLSVQWLGNSFSHLLKLPLPYFEKRHTGDIVSRFGSIQTIQQSLTSQFVEGIIDGTLVLGTLGMMLLYSPKLAGIACIAVSIYAILRWSIFHTLREATVEQIMHTAKQQTYFMESVRGIQSIRLFGRSEMRCAGWMNALTAQINATLRIAKMTVSYQTANTLLFNGERIIIIWLAALAVLDNTFSVGMLYAFISYKDQFSQRVASLIDRLFELRMLRLHGDRVADIVMTEAEQGQQEAEVSHENISLSIELRNVSYRYADNEPDVLSGVNLVIPAGQCVAITGPSGSGKTTLLKILLGLHSPTKGEIFIGGMKLTSLGLRNFRGMLGTVMQDDTLFAGSLADNISFFDPASNLERVYSSAKMAAIHDEISTMPMGYHTLVGDIGTGLSGGQKQRVLLARALYRRPKLLVLDEATSHLDLANERTVNNAIRAIKLTRVIVAHREETINMAERVVVLRDGKVLKDSMEESVTSQTAA